MAKMQIRFDLTSHTIWVFNSLDSYCISRDFELRASFHSVGGFGKIAEDVDSCPPPPQGQKFEIIMQMEIERNLVGKMF